jgi:rRNA maturation endonuclease Nob1
MRLREFVALFYLRCRRCDRRPIESDVDRGACPACGGEAVLYGLAEVLVGS